MGGKKSSPATQTTNPSTVWDPQAGYLQDMYSQAQNVYRQQSGQKYTPGAMATHQVLNPAYAQFQLQNANQQNMMGQLPFDSHMTGGDGGNSTPFIGGWQGGGFGNFGQSYGKQSAVIAPAQYIDEQYQQEGTWGQDPNFVDKGQQYLDQYAGQLGLAGQALGQSGQTFQDALGQMRQAGQGYQQGYAGLGNAADLLNQSFNNVGRGYGALDQAMGQYGTANQGYQQGYGALNQAQAGFNSFMNPAINPMSDVYARQTGQQFREQIMPELQGQQMLTGGFGGSRGQIGEGLAGARMGQQMLDYNAGLYNNQMNRSLTAAQSLGQNALGYGSLAQGQGNLGTAMGNIGAQQTGLGNAFAGLGGQYGNLSGLQNAQPWNAIRQYQGLLGNPTTLSGGGTAQGAQAGSSGGLGTAIGLAGLVAAPFTGGASLALASGANAAVDRYYK